VWTLDPEASLGAMLPCPALGGAHRRNSTYFGWHLYAYGVPGCVHMETWGFHIVKLFLWGKSYVYEGASADFGFYAGHTAPEEECVFSYGQPV